MANKRMRLPREGVTGTGDEAKAPDFIGEDDVTGHGLPITAPPADFSKRTPTSGGELFPTDTDRDDDGEAHR
jgi:hypothetical protein